MPLLAIPDPPPTTVDHDGSAVVDVLSLPTPPAWDLLRADVRAAYIDALAAAGVRVDWPIESGGGG